ncbi:MAG: hypothetical protein IKD45_03105 [Clostridia bacterium]|nr:hypothetical protein [Clostridia bacterium]
MEENRVKRICVPLLQGALIFLWTLAIKGLTFLVVYLSSTSRDSVFNDFPNWGIHLIVISAGLFIYNSVVRLVTLFDRDERDRYFAMREEGLSFWGELLSVMRSRDFIFENLSAVPLFFIAAMLDGFPEVGSFILGDGMRGTVLCGAVSAAIIAPLYFIIGIFTRYEVRRYWVVLDRNQETYKCESAIRLFAGALLISLSYPLVYPYIPLLLFFVFNIFSILFSIVGALSIIGTVAVILLIFVIIWVIPILRGILKRKKFIKQLRAICREKGIDVSSISHPYRSFIRPRTEENFKLSANGKEYHCAFVSTLHRGTYLYFTSSTDAYFRHRIGTENHHFTIKHTVEYGILTEGKKCIIISPMPKHIYVEEGGAVRELFVGDRVWDYTVYNMSGFINAIDRDCLDKYNVSRD